MSQGMRQADGRASATALDTRDRRAVAAVSGVCGLAGLWALLSGGDVLHLAGGAAALGLGPRRPDGGRAGAPRAMTMSDGRPPKVER